MTLSTSRQQFLAYETQSPEDIQYGRKGGVFLSTCVCVTFILFAVVLAALVGVIVYFITYFKLSQNNGGVFWDDTEPFGHQAQPSPDLRLPAFVVPSFYRLKLHTDLENSNFTGEVYITIRANKPVKEIILHSKDLSINSNAKLTEQIYERVETLHTKSKREVNTNSENETVPLENNIVNGTDVPISSNETVEITSTTAAIPNNDTTTQTIVETTTQTVTQSSVPSIDTQVTHSSVRNIKIISISEATGDRLILKLASALTTNVDYTLQLSFSGQISNSLTGFYKSTYTNSQKNVKKLGVTQFEPTSARAAFPCFDEPAFKAMFEISVAHPGDVSVLSNMNVSTQEAIAEQPGWKWTHFERSVNMSTYLVAYVLSDFKSLETSYLSKGNVTKVIRVWTRPELIHKAKYALNITPKLLSFYEDVFGVPYALDKMDLIAIPDFSSGAMENWGLITFRETTLLFDEVEGVPREKQSVAIDVAHELAHQWFGNLVTMRWWTDLWLNEGFATYIEYIGVDYIEPEWNMLETFIRDKMDLLRSDALKNTSPVSRQVIDASEISQKFDEISYNKGANLIRMLNHTISEELFHKGLVIYLNDWKYTNAEENDLWKAMSAAAASAPSLRELSLVEFMNSWTRQAGYPVVEVRRDYDKGRVEMTQRLFTSTQEPYPSMVDQLWHIPVSYTSVGSPPADWAATPKLWLKDRNLVVDLPINGSDALYVNVDAIGYYRVNYDKKNWELLNAALKSGQIKSAIAKAQLIDDAFNLAKVAQLDYSYALGLTTCVINGEDSKIVWEMLLNNMGFLKHNLKATSGYVYFQDYMRMLLKTQLERLNYGLDKPKNDNEAFLAENLVMWECFMEAPRCLDWARGQFHAWMNRTDFNDNPIPNYLRSLVYNVALKYGGRREFDFLWRVFSQSADPSVKAVAINSLPATRDEALITMLLEKSLTEIPKQYAVAVWSVEAPAGARVAAAFLRQHFERAHAVFTAMDAFMFPAVLNGAFGAITDEDDLDKLKSFALQHKQQLLPMSQTLQKLTDTAALRIHWLRRHAGPINQWFRDYVTNTTTNATSTTPSSVTPDSLTSSTAATPLAGNSTANLPIAPANTANSASNANTTDAADAAPSSAKPPETTEVPTRPSPTMTTSIAASTLLSNTSSIYEGPFHLRSPPLGTRVQQLWLYAEILTNNDDEEIFDKSFQISISIDGVISDHRIINLIPESEATNRTQHLKCKKQVCEEVMVLHLGALEYTHYVLNIRFHGLKEFHKRYYMREVIFYFKTYNPAFTQMETWFRFIFLLTTFTIACWFAHTLRKYSTQDWAIEQKWLSILLPLLLLYNDPIFPLRLVSSSCFAPLVDSVFQTAFLACVMLSWLAQYHGLRQNERGFLSFYLIKVIVVGLVWTPAMVITIWQKYYGFYDPTFNYMMNPNYPVVKIMFFSAVVLYFLYLIFLIIKAYSDLRNMPFFDIRLKCLSTVVGTVLALAGALGAARWGAAALQDHWAHHAHATSAPFMAMYGLFNFNIYIQAYLFSPAGGSVHETAITKDNPAFSMINDSDEEVIYGSDEESRRPLNSHHRINNEDI